MEPQIDVAGPSRRTVLKLLGAGGLVAALPGLAACSSSPGDIRLEETKPEVVGYFDNLVSEFNKTHPGIHVTHDSTSSLIAQFVRGAPPDIDCDNYNLTTSIFIARGVLANLAHLPEAKTIDPKVQALVTQYAQFGHETSVLPFSIAAAGVIYNVETFDKAGVEVPRTWSELLAACDKFKSKNIVPIYATYKDSWTVQQGMWDYVGGGTLNVADFFRRLNDEGDNLSSSSPVSFEKDFAPVVDKMQQLLPYSNSDAASRAYADGNSAFAQGQGAMYLQGPWAIGEIAAINPKLKVATFPLPATDNPDDTKCRVNLDLAIWIPRSLSGAKRANAIKVLQYLMQPQIVNAYNQTNLAFSPLKNPPPVRDSRIAGLEPYVRSGRFYQGPGTYVPNVIPIGNYLQAFVLTKNGKQLLQKLDSDFRRLAKRTSA
jgi:raffinose/stachyose/melibiose transport system substrate-binding protein